MHSLEKQNIFPNLKLPKFLSCKSLSIWRAPTVSLLSSRLISSGLSINDFGFAAGIFGGGPSTRRIIS